VSVTKGNTIYLHILTWSGDVFRLPLLPVKIVSTKALTGGKVMVNQTARGIEISVPPDERNEVDTIIALITDGEAGRPR
jgi:hypothetical protein